MFFSLFVGLTAISASAQSRATLSANVPFDFQVGSRALSAGEYTIQQFSSSDSGLVIRSADGKQRALALSHTVESNSKQSRRSRLVFNKYGEQYFLASIWEDNGECRMLHQSAAERNVRRETASLKSSEPEIVIVELSSK
jgi:hypothetical protein